MKKLLFYTFAILVCNCTFAQIGIGTTNPQSLLDVRSSNQATPLNTDGLIIPKVDQFSTTSPTAQQHGMLVQLTTTVGSNTPGFYYWNNPTSTWLPLAGGNVGWDIIGNAGTNPTTNFLGTTDAQSLVIRTNNAERLRVLTNGNVGIGLTNPTARIEANVYASNDFATIKANGNYDAQGYLGVQGKPNFDGIATADWSGMEIGVVGISAGTSSTDNIGVLGHSNTVGVRAEHTNGNNWAELGTTSYAGLFNGRVEMQSATDASGTAGTGVLEIANSLRLDGNEIITNSNSPLYINSDNNGDVIMDGSTFRMDASTNRIGIGAFPGANKLEIINTTAGDRSLFISKTNGSTEAAAIINYGTGTGLRVVSSNDASDGITVSSGGNYCNLNYAGSINTGVSGINAAAENIGVEGRATNTNLTTNDKMGGLFYVSSSTTNSIPAFGTVGSIVDNIVYKILGYGIVSTLVKDTEDKDRIMVAPEAPEALFQDYGIGQLTNGRAHITLDPILTKNIAVDENHPLKVFVQLEGDCQGVYVTNKSATGFDVIELNNGQANVSFSYQLVANRADENRGGHISKYADMRFRPLKNKITVKNTEDQFIEESSESSETSKEIEIEKEIAKSELTPNTNETKKTN